MTARFSEGELKALGYKQNPDGSFSAPGRQSSPVRDKNSGEVSNVQRLQQPLSPEDDEDEEGSEIADSAASRRFTIGVVAFRKREMDPDNLVPKWYIDALVDAGVIPDDSSRYINGVWKSVQRTRGEEYTKIIISTETND